MTDNEKSETADDQDILVEVGETTLEGDPVVAVDAVEDTPKEGAAALAEQLEAARFAETQARQERDEARAQAAEALRIAQDRDMRARQEYAAREDAQHATLQTGLHAAQSEREAARQKLKIAQETGDYDAAADATEQLGRVAYEIKQYEIGIAQVSEQRRQEAEYAEYQRRNPQRQQQQPRQFSPQEITEAIDSDTNLMPLEKAWMKKHPNDRVDPKRQQLLQIACQRAAEDGHARNTPGYLKRVDDIMGYRDNQRTSSPGAVSAPVSRDAPTLSGRQAQGNRVVLTKGDQEIATALGIDLTNKEERERYARNKRNRANEPAPQNIN